MNGGVRTHPVIGDLDVPCSRCMVLSDDATHYVCDSVGTDHCTREMCHVCCAQLHIATGVFFYCDACSLSLIVPSLCTKARKFLQKLVLNVQSGGKASKQLDPVRLEPLMSTPLQQCLTLLGYDSSYGLVLVPDPSLLHQLLTLIDCKH